MILILKETVSLYWIWELVFRKERQRVSCAVGTKYLNIII
jgi:hypothetical protein